MLKPEAMNSTLGRCGGDLFDWARSMPTLRAIFLLLMCGGATALGATNAAPQAWIIETGDEGSINWNLVTGEVTYTNGVSIGYGGTRLAAQQVRLNRESGEVAAEGNVTLELTNRIWRGDRVLYNFKTGEISGGDFRMGQAPLFASGEGFAGSRTNNVYVVADALLTTDDYAQPGYSVRAKSITIVPGEYVECRNAVLYLGDVPVFWFPYYRKSLKQTPNHWTLTPGYRNTYGPYLLTAYNWYWNDKLEGALHFDERVERGPGVGPDVTYHLPQFGTGTAKYYYTYDKDPNEGAAPSAGSIPNNRQRVWYEHHGTLATNLTIKSAVKWQSDSQIVRDFFQTEYRENSQPSSYLDLAKAWPNWSLDLFVMPQVNDFQQTIERLPEVKLTGLQQRVGPTPLFYESVTSFGYFESKYTNDTQAWYAATRADTFQQLSIPFTLFDWLNVSPRAGGRYSYYGTASGPGATTTEQDRWIFNTGVEFSAKASRLWPAAKSRTFDVDGIRHIIQPLVNYAYVPNPSVATNLIPQFDYLLPSAELLPITFPEFNSIDAIQAENVIRFGLRNKLQTKRSGVVDNLVNWALYMDWNITTPNAGQETFSDVYSKIDFKPRQWLTFSSELAYNINETTWDQANHYLNIVPNDRWSWFIGQRYLRPGAFYGTNGGNNLVFSSIYFRMNENWGLHMSHYYNIENNVWQQQRYTIYRDLRSWTVALSFQVLRDVGGDVDWGGAITFSLKSSPRYALGKDIDHPSLLLGY